MQDKPLTEQQKSRLRKLIIEKKQIDEDETKASKKINRLQNEIVIRKQKFNDEILDVLQLSKDEVINYNDLILRVL
jgi:hypothetical protein